MTREAKAKIYSDGYTTRKLLKITDLKDARLIRVIQAAVDFLDSMEDVNITSRAKAELENNVEIDCSKDMAVISSFSVAVKMIHKLSENSLSQDNDSMAIKILTEAKDLFIKLSMERTLQSWYMHASLYSPLTEDLDQYIDRPKKAAV